MSSAGPMYRMSHRKWSETKQQLTLWPDLALFGSCLVSLHFLCDIQSWVKIAIFDLDLQDHLIDLDLF